MDLIVFSRRTCPPCRRYLPVLQELIEEGYPIQIHMTENPGVLELASEYGIRAVPTTLFMHGENEIIRHSGFIPKEKLVEMFQKIEEYGRTIDRHAANNAGHDESTGAVEPDGPGDTGS